LVLLRIEEFSGTCGIRNQATRRAHPGKQSGNFQAVRSTSAGRSEARLDAMRILIQHPDGDLQPIGFHSSKLLHFEPRLAFSLSFEPLHEFREPFNSRSCALNFVLRGRRFYRLAPGQFATDALRWKFAVPHSGVLNLRHDVRNAFASASFNASRYSSQNGIMPRHGSSATHNTMKKICHAPMGSALKVNKKTPRQAASSRQ